MTKKPYPEFPLTVHDGAGQWCKKFRRRTHFFGKLDNWKPALNLYREERDDSIAGRQPHESCAVQAGHLLRTSELTRLTLDNVRNTTSASRRRRPASSITAAGVEDARGCLPPPPAIQ